MIRDYWIEAVPNICSADPVVLERISRVFEHNQSAQLLHVDSSLDVGRSVLTIIGPSKAVYSAITSILHVCEESINIFEYNSIHPHIGALDVCPFIAIDAHDQDRLISDSYSFAQLTSEKFRLPIFHYAHMAIEKERASLHHFRKGGPTTLCKRLENSNIQPDHGPSNCHPSLGSLVLGVRHFMIAYNINLPDATLDQAKLLAAHIRKHSSGLKAIGWYNPEYASTQLSLNLYDRDITMPSVYNLAIKYAKRMQLSVGASELIGLTTLSGLGIHATDRALLSDKIDASIDRLQLNALKPFDPSMHILDLQISRHLGTSIFL
ncbi:MAG: hypothetical protein KTR24_06000 [Saprospiraceae bacterium]|nr:hypothetical protein [Saprospiraceae bacterium]